MKMNDTSQFRYWWTGSLAAFSVLSTQDYIFIVGVVISAWFTIKTYYANRHEKNAQLKEEQKRTELLSEFLQDKTLETTPEAIAVVNEALQRMEAE